MSGSSKIANKYRVLTKIGKGKFGDVFKGEHTRTGELVAIKFERPECPIKILKHETSVLNYLYTNHCSQIPPVYWFGQFQEIPTLIMPFYETSLEHIVKDTSTISMEQQLDWIQQIMDILESIHKNFILHRDIKPQNFMVKGDRIYLIDFGLAKLFVEDNEVSSRKNTILGTPKFISIHIHDGFEPSFRDDLISVGYIWLYMYTKTLPWENISPLAHPSQFQDIDVLHENNQLRRYHKSATIFLPYCQDIHPRLGQFVEKLYAIGERETISYPELCVKYKNTIY